MNRYFKLIIPFASKAVLKGNKDDNKMKTIAKMLFMYLISMNNLLFMNIFK